MSPAKKTKSESSKDNFKVGSCNWFIDPCEFNNIKVMTRYNSKPFVSELEINADKVNVYIKESRDIPCAGQVAAFYSEDMLIGGGIIEKD